jgi:23S rRNA (pseudouridine1915-N3)-methyltransferase
MRLTIVAVGQRMPTWAQLAWDDFYKRFPADFRVELKTVKAEPRGSKTVSQLVQAEALRLISAIPKDACVMALDERGKSYTSEQFSKALAQLSGNFRDIALLIGGPDGLSEEIKDNAHQMIRLSDMTLPHAMVRVVLIEQLYRACSMLNNHPYHRE